MRNIDLQEQKQFKITKMDMKKEIELIELRAQVSLLYELLHEFNGINFSYTSFVITNTLQDKDEQIKELEKQRQNETNV